jgi:hypothetical protein
VPYPLDHFCAKTSSGSPCIMRTSFVQVDP